MDNSQMGLTGEFYVLAQLMQRGLVATLTLGNTKGVDILVSNAEMNRLFKVEVKTTNSGPQLERRFGNEPCYVWAMSEKQENVRDPSLFYCFVALKGVGELPRFFVAPSAYVAAYVREQHQFWLRTQKSPGAPTSIRRFRIEESDPLHFEGNFGLLEGKEIPSNQLDPKGRWPWVDRAL
jgi:hypothetical protein